MTKFLSLDFVLHIHEVMIDRYGGSPGIRDQNLLESALAQPEASFGGEYFHEDIFQQSAAYGFHICENHPFVDGNKRVAFMAMYTFLDQNGYELTLTEKQAYAVMIKLAKGELTKEKLAAILHNSVKHHPGKD